MEPKHLDKNCLIQGQNWEVGFTVGLHHSKCILILISDGTVASMKSKALRGETDNVFKEHKMALQLMKENGVIVIPVYVASLAKTKHTNRDSYVNLDQEKSLRSFDEPSQPPEVVARLQEVKATLSEIFSLRGVNIEPDAIAEKIPRLVQMYHDASVLKDKQNTAVKLHTKIKFAIVRIIKHPTARFRLTVFGTIVGFFTTLLSLVLLYMPSKSPQHTALKRGIAYGNICGILVLITAIAALIAGYSTFNSGVYCSECESVLTSTTSARATDLRLLYRTVPRVDIYLNQCDCNKKNQTTWATTGCLECACRALYQDCEYESSLLIVLYVLIAFGVLIILATALFIQMFSTMEAYQMSFSQ